MKLQGVILGTLACVFAAIGGAMPVKAATTTWVGGASGLWNSGANWSSGLVPTAADDVFLTNGTHATITVQFGEYIRFNNLTIASSTLLLDGDIASGSNIAINGDGVFQQGNDHVQKILNDLVLNGGLLTHTPLPLSSRSPMVNIEATNIMNSGYIDVSGRGYAGGGLNQNGQGSQGGIGSPSGASGGAACGNSGAGLGGSMVVGTASPVRFESSFDYGSGGGGDASKVGGAGGGKLKLSVRNTINNLFLISANGSGGASFASGGAGGSVWISAKSLTPLNASDIANANGGNAPMVSGGGGSGGCARLDYYVTTTFGSGPLSIGQIVPGGTGLNNGSDGDYRVYLRAAPAISFAAVTGTSPLSSSQLSWGWGGGLLDSFYRLYTVSGTSTVSSSPIFSTANTTTLSYLVTGLTPATRYRYAIQSVSSTPRPVFNLNAGQTLVEIIGTSTYKFVDHVIVPQPLQAVVGPVGPTSVSMALDYGLNPGTTPMTVVDGSGYYYNANGSPSGLTPVYIPVNTWSNSFISLSPSTSYVFTFLPFTPVTDDFSGAITYYQATSSLVVSTTTPLATPTTPTIGSVSTSSIALTWTQNGNPATTPYAVYNKTLNQYHLANGTLSPTPTFYPLSSWNGSAKGLTPSTKYLFQIVLRNEDGTQNATSTENGTYTNNPDNTPFSLGGGSSSSGGGASTTASMGSTTSTGWYFGTPGSSTTYPNTPGSTTTSPLAPTPGGTTAYYLPDGTLITPQLIFQMMMNANNNPSLTFGNNSVSLYKGKNLASNILFSNFSTTADPLKVKTTLKFNYTYTNPNKKNTYRIERVLLSPLGKVLTKSTAYRTIKLGEKVTYLPSQYFTNTLTTGLYTIRVRITSLDTKTIYDENSFDVSVKK